MAKSLYLNSTIYKSLLKIYENPADALKYVQNRLLINKDSRVLDKAGGQKEVPERD